MKTRRDEEKRDEDYLKISSAKTSKTKSTSQRGPPQNSLFYTGPIDREELLQDRRITRSMVADDEDIEVSSGSKFFTHDISEEEKDPEMKLTHRRRSRRGGQRQQHFPTEASSDDELQSDIEGDVGEDNKMHQPYNLRHQKKDFPDISREDRFYYVNEKDPHRSVVQSPFPRTSKGFSFITALPSPQRHHRLPLKERGGGGRKIRRRSRSTIRSRPSLEQHESDDLKSAFRSHSEDVMSYTSLLSNSQFNPLKNVGSIQPQIYGDIVIDDNHQVHKIASHFDLMNISLWICVAGSFASMGYTALVYLSQLRQKYTNASWGEFFYESMMDSMIRYPKKTTFNEYASVALWLCYAFFLFHAILNIYRLYRLDYLRWISSSSLSTYFSDHSAHHQEDADEKHEVTNRPLTRSQLTQKSSGDLPCNVPATEHVYECEVDLKENGFPNFFRTRFFALTALACVLPSVIGLSVSFFLLTIFLRFQGDPDKQSMCYTSHAPNHQEYMKTYANIQHAIAACGYAIIFSLGLTLSLVQLKPLTSDSLHHNVIIDGFNNAVNGAYTLELMWCSLALAFRLAIHLRTKSQLESLARMNIVIGSIIQYALVFTTAFLIFSTSGVIIPAFYFMTNEIIRLFHTTPSKSPVEQHIYYQTAIHSDI